MKPLLQLALLLALAASLAAQKTESRAKMFSIFSVVNFPNSQCTTMSSASSNPVMYGTCQSADTCASVGGTADGNCASGFGVCCMITLSACGAVISQNVTYITNPGYPTTYNTLGTCTYSFNANPAICQIRLDFDNMVLANPDVAANFGNCANDQFTTNARTPPICGLNTGQHMYLETGRDTNYETITFNLANVNNANRSWKIRSTFIECISNYRAPTDCLQYFTGLNGAFKSFNFQTTAPQVLQSQNYNICIRQAEGYCRVEYAVNDDPNNAVVPFKLDNGGNTMNFAKRLCNASAIGSFWITIPSIVQSSLTSNSEMFCGARFNTQATAMWNGRVIGNQPPFRVGVWGMAAAQFPMAAGFNLMYSQTPC